MLSEVLRAGRESTAGLFPLSTPDSILIRYRKWSRWVPRFQKAEWRFCFWHCLKKRRYIGLLHMGVVKAPLCSDCLLTLAFIKAVAVAEEE